MERPTGFEPATSSLGSWHSATELRPRSTLIIGLPASYFESFTAMSYPLMASSPLAFHTIRLVAP